MSTRWALTVVVGLVSPCLVAQNCATRLVPAREPVFLETTGPQGIVRDPSDGSFWITLALSLDLVHVSADLEEIERIPTDLPPEPGALFDGLTGIAYDERNDTLLVVRPVSDQIWEVDRDGRATGRVIPLVLPGPPTLDRQPYPKGITFGPAGSIWLVESIMTAIYELRSDGTILSEFCHPDDPDGCPGERAAALSSDVKTFAGDDGELFLEVVGGSGRRDRIHRLEEDGTPTGLTYDLSDVGGTVSGFLRGTFDDPDSGGTLDVLFVLVESSAELHVLRVEEPRIVPPFDISCTVRSGGLPGVEIRWRNAQSYDAIQIFREGERLTSIGGGVSGYTDVGAPDGIVEYEVRALLDDCAAGVTCSALIGAGSVIRSVRLAERFAIDLAEDGDGQLWLTRGDNVLEVWSKDLELLAELPGPFSVEEDVTSGIAYDPVADSLFVYNTTTHDVVEIDPLGKATGFGFPSHVADDPQSEDAAVAAMLVDPDGDDGAGSFWYLELLTSTLQERARDGTLLRSCVHPDIVGEVIPQDSGLRAYGWGMSTVPGHGFEVIELSGGRIRDRRATRILQIDTADCLPTGDEIPVSGLAELSSTGAVAIHRTTHDDREVIFAILVGRSTSWLAEIEAGRPDIPFATEITCIQEDDANDVRLTFRVREEESVEGIEIRRDGDVIATLPPDAMSFLDRGVAGGLHDYCLRVTAGGDTSDDRGCGVLVGPGSFIERRFSAPLALIHDIDYEPRTERYLVSSAATVASRSLHAYDRELCYVEEIPTGFRAPDLLAAQAVRIVDGESEVYCLGWVPGSGTGQQEFPLRVLTPRGDLVRVLTIVLPAPPSVFVTFPSGFAWDEELDSFWLLERNSDAVYNISPSGEILSRFRHPAPVHQDGVHNYGLAVDGRRGALLLSSAGRRSRAIDRIVEVTRHGELTGTVIPLDVRATDRVWGFELRPQKRSLVVAAGRPEPWSFGIVRAFTDVAPVEDLVCVPVDRSLRLVWTNAQVYDEIAVHRGSDLVATLAGNATSWIEPDADLDTFYRVVATRAGVDSRSALCSGEPGRAFLRGDVEPDGTTNLSDAVRILEVLFLGGAPISCLDAADVDDDGGININDAIRLLNFLFLGGPPPAVPFPGAGRDWTIDALSCRGE